MEIGLFTPIWDSRNFYFIVVKGMAVTENLVIHLFSRIVVILV